jgi:hypothetical protein
LFQVHNDVITSTVLLKKERAKLKIINLNYNKTFYTIKSKDAEKKETGETYFVFLINNQNIKFFPFQS